MTRIRSRLPLLSALFGALLSQGALAQQAGAYAPPPPAVIIGPVSGPNPYLIYVPAPQAVQMPSLPSFLPPPPAAIAPAPPQMPAPAPEASATTKKKTLSDLGESLGSYFTQEEMDLLVEYMKESVLAAFKGEEVFLPPDLAFKLEVLLVRLKKEGTLYMDNLIKQLEADLKRSLEEKLTPPAAKPAPLPEVQPATAPAPGNVKATPKALPKPARKAS
ncbi:MAG: hypothetical protein AB1421_05915 [Pseudomonadota bacterium]